MAFVVGALAIGVVAVTAGGAQAGDARAEAKAKLQQGAQLLQRGEYAQALTRFQDAFALVPSPKIQFNFGLAYGGLQRHAEALEAFEKFIDEAKDASPSTRAEAKQQIESLRGKIETVHVASDREGANVSIDGRSYGLTPLPRPIYVDPGAHQLVVQDGDRPLVQNFTAFAGKDGTFTMRFATAEPRDKNGGDRKVTALKPPLRPPPEQQLITQPGGAGTEASHPLYTRPWFWATLGGVLVAGAVATLFLTRKTEYPTASLGTYSGN